jgi:hypothetical protein
MAESVLHHLREVLSVGFPMSVAQGAICVDIGG